MNPEITYNSQEEERGFLNRDTEGKDKLTDTKIKTKDTETHAEDTEGDEDKER